MAILMGLELHEAMEPDHAFGSLVDPLRALLEWGQIRDSHASNPPGSWSRQARPLSSPLDACIVGSR